ncbi:hypothetical protein EDB87DRAFT_1692494 [Lactarius vividus]|nr:hypothetical protein EDB87DRAFT_1692494 [Lactarius vividus]
MVSSSLTSTHSTEAWEPECDQHEPEEVVEHGFGYPLQRMVPIESMQLGGEESPLSGLYRMPPSQSSSTSSHMFYIDFEAVVDEYLSHYQNSDAHDMVFVEADTAGAPSEMSTSLILRRVKLHSTELALLRALNGTEIPERPMEPRAAAAPHRRARRRRDPLPRAPIRLRPPTTTDRRERGRLHPPGARGTVLSTRAQDRPLRVWRPKWRDDGHWPVELGLASIARGCPVRYYRVNFSRAKELPHEADLRSASFCRDVYDCGAMFQVLVEEVPKIGGKLRSLVVAMTGGGYGAEDARKLFEALCKGIDASTYDAPLQLPALE